MVASLLGGIVIVIVVVVGVEVEVDVVERQLACWLTN